MMQNYQNFQPYQQPYALPYQVPVVNNNIYGKMVDDFNSIGVNDVSMDGNASVFLKRDLSEIQVRKWGSDGRIYSTSYKPLELNNNSVETIPQDSNLDALNERLQAIEDKLDKLIKPTAKKVVNDVNN